MRILIVAAFFPPNPSIASLRPYSWAKYWSRQGHEVTVLTLPTSEVTWEANEYKVIRIPHLLHNLSQAAPLGKKRGLFQSFLDSLRSRFVDYKNRKGFLRSCRMPDLTDLWIQPALRTLENCAPWDLVVSTSGPYATHIIAHKLKKRGLAKRWIADFRDPWSDNTIFPGLFPFRLLEPLLERRLMHTADAITTVSPILKAHLGDRHGQHKTHLIENGIDLEDFASLDPTPVFAPDGKFRLVHTGTCYDGINNPIPLLQALEGIEVDVEVIFAGNHGRTLPEEVAKRGLSHLVKLLPPVPRETSLRMQRDAQALLFLPFGDIETNGIVSGKIFEYLYWGTPIVSVGGSSNTPQIQLLPEVAISPNFGCDVEKIRNYLLTPERNTPAPIIERFSRERLAEKMLNLASS